ncbi:IclR family transcriptional regulator [Bosea sp. BK604]|uniref:IclR family transcriptional regulator n=1 Tax=Bosea sp. BK604 TaxID=2512180 RepID=UPI0010F3D5E8|nr:IclR family transcriptional regulator [Bosea sp. BK604]TCR66594.1 IclR family transcriptional regulator [Bosea sp. BK604]
MDTQEAVDAAAEGSERYRAPALDKGLDILELLSEQSAGLTRGEIVKAMGRGPSEIYRMLERLVARDYVVRSSGGDRYALSMKLFVLANRHPPIRRLVAQAQPQMDAFARQTGQSCHLVVPDRGAAIVVAQASPMDTWEFRVRVGARLGLLDTGSGLTLLAFQNPARRTETLAVWGGSEALAQLHRIETEFAATRARGYRQGPSRQLLGITDLSAPILSPEGDAVAVVTCAWIGRPGSEPEAAMETTVAQLRRLAAELSLS